MTKRRRIGRGLNIGALATALALSACHAAPEDSANTSAVANSAALPAGSTEVRIRTSSGQTHRFVAELAADKEAQQHGLMGRETLADDAGMIFSFAYPNMASFWMKDTRVPLDLLFIRTDGTIADILEGEPNSLRPLAANEPVTAVLEIRQGRAEALGIDKGDRIEWGDCATDAGAGAGRAPVWRADRFCPSSQR
ncbi:uncharacterized membrane protein (UPF0127 family) [Sphingobium sp. B2D3A]|uniref:DUF192 domain-containing protein n=1 Tax=unclassified Sphingobium TaxID=2611147 RepID=UPI002224F167|nr:MULTISPECIES: DUF192 domain-containing protein [unclassified Sphingobium]MCW2337800.1 uncharacterized membrane protein (UPF0127 family) [Sphingobium sp. B2D3A]MCW2384258.1 uncharacterized membrane protein (UPF0127 family) [Sphingobium sp. B2D3D]